MKRDMELIRKILLYIEENEEPMSSGINIKFDEYSEDVVCQHLKLMYDDGFFDDFNVFLGGSHLVMGLTNSAYDYLDMIRDEDIWKDTNKTMEEKKIPKTIENIAKVAGTIVGAAINQIFDK